MNQLTEQHRCNFLPGQHLRVMPHYQLSGPALRFLTSRRAALSLSPDEVAIWKDLADTSNVAELARRHGDPFYAFAARLVDSGVAIVIDPKPDTPRRKVLVVEPHSDDAALSVGATMFKMRQEVEFTLLTACSLSNYTSNWHMGREYFSVSDVTALRTAESVLFMACLNGRHHALGLQEAPLRYRQGKWSLEWFNRHRVSISANNNHRVSEDELVAMTEALRPIIRDSKYDAVWIPLGVGTHSDHEMVRNACLRVIASTPTSFHVTKWMAYQDVPYDSNYPAHTGRVISALRKSGGELVHRPQLISAEMSQKKKLLGIFASQFKVHIIEKGVDSSASAGAANPGELKEHLWSIESLPTDLPEQDMYLDAEQVAEAAMRMQRSKLHESMSRGLQLILVVPPGRWRLDYSRLAARFPKVVVDVFAFPASWAEFEENIDPRVAVRRLRKGILGWAKLFLLALRHPTRPLVMVSGIHRKRLAGRFRVMFPLAPYLVVESFDHFSQALALVTRDTARDGHQPCAEVELPA